MSDDNRVSVSIIVPLFNAQKRLPHLFKSLAGQTYPHQLTEIIFVDNGSTDGTAQQLKEFTNVADIPVRIVQEFDYPGSYAARNKGIDHASGEILAFTDADCIPEKDWIANAVARLSVEGRNAVIGGRVDLVAEDVRKPTPVEMFELVLGFPQEENIIRDGYSVTANLHAWKSAFEVVGPFNSSLKSKGDYEWCMRAGGHGYRILYAPDVGVVHPARRSLGEIVLKTRRVTGGQVDIKSDSKASADRTRNKMGELFLLVRRNSRFPSWKSKASILAVAGIVLMVKVTEKVRLRFGGERERR